MLFEGVTFFLATVVWQAQIVYSGLSDEELLDAKLTDNFDTRVRPRLTHGSSPTNISAGIYLSHIHQVDIARSEIEMTVLLNLAWIDPRLRWDVQQTENQIRQLILPEHNVWIPDITIYNAIGEIKPIHTKQVLVVPGGLVTWLQAYHVTVGCATNATAVVQTCMLKIGSWRYDGSNVDIYSVNDNFTTSEDFFSREWELLEGSTVERVLHNRTWSATSFPLLIATLELFPLIEPEMEATPEPPCMIEEMITDSSASGLSHNCVCMGLFLLSSLCILKR